VKVRFAVAPDPGPRDGAELLAFAVAVEASGFDGVWLSDLPLGPALDPLLGLALIAGGTGALRLGANIVPLGRNPFLLAKALAQLDQLSHGRLLLSFVTGLGQPGERDALGWDGAGRGAVLESVLARVRSWWTGAEAAAVAQGDAAALAAVVRPVQDPLEVWLGGRAPAALDRVGRIADGWLGAQLTPPEAQAARVRIEQAAASAGRQIDPEHYGLSIAYARTTPDAALLARRAGGRKDVDPRAFIPVGADALRELISGHLEAGLSKFVLRPLTRVSAWEDEARWLAGAILDLQS
jgi:probable F420-dependent oxidoreductase